VEDICRYEAEFLDYLRRNNEGLLTSIRETKVLTDDNIGTLKDAIDRFRRTFEVTGGQLLVSDEGVEPLSDDEEKQESISRYEPPAPAEAE